MSSETQQKEREFFKVRAPLLNSTQSNQVKKRLIEYKDADIIPFLSDNLQESKVDSEKMKKLHQLKRSKRENKSESIEESNVKEQELEPKVLHRVKPSYCVLGINECVRCIKRKELRMLIILSDKRTTPLLSDLLILAYQEKLPVLALRGSNKKVLETIKVSRVACIGIKNTDIPSKSVESGIVFLESIASPMNLSWC